MVQTIGKDNRKVLLDKDRLIGLQQKAAFLDELLDFIEDKTLGYLMDETEQEKNISLSQAKKAMS